MEVVRGGMVLLLVAGLGGAVGCLTGSTYACDSDLQCRHPDRSGACTPSGWCAYSNEGCESGWQYSAHAEDGVASTCVPMGEGPSETTGASVPGDGSSTGSTPDLCAEPCIDPPGDCWDPGSGACEGGACVFDPRPAGEICQDDCSSSGFCDASGTCVCAEDGGSSSSGSTGGDPVDECEATCIVGEHATAAACDRSGACVVTCEAPWENCDADPSNGCEVPVGVAHQCDAAGLNPDGGCWTAYCGESMAAGAFNFGTYHCMDCATCREPGGGTCQWCDHDTGNFFPTAECVCGAEFLDVSCG